MADQASEQYAPEMLPEMVGSIQRGEADVLLGSRMMVPGAARGGHAATSGSGTACSRSSRTGCSGTELSEYHSGYRAYRIDALQSVPLERNSDDFDFDTQILIQLHHAGKRVVEIPIPTFYGDEISRVNGLRYARQVSAEAGPLPVGAARPGRRTALPGSRGLHHRALRAQGGRRVLARSTPGLARASALRAGSWTSDARAACWPSGCASSGTTWSEWTSKSRRGGGTGGRVRPGRPGPGDPRCRGP